MKQVSPEKVISFLKKCTTFFFAFGNVSLLVLFAVGFAARWLPSNGYWWAQVVAAGLDTLALLLLLFGLIWLLARKRYWALGNAIGVLLWAIRFFPFTFQSQNPQPEDLAVLSYNLSFQVNTTYEHDLAQFYQFFRQLSPTLATFQEGYTWKTDTAPFYKVTPHLRFLVDSLKYHVAIYDSLNQLVEPAILANDKLKLDNITPIRGGLWVPENVRMPKAIFGLRVPIEWQGRKAVLYSFHLNSLGDNKPWDYFKKWKNSRTWDIFEQQYRVAYQMQFEQVTKIKAMMQRETDPIIIMGDFNNTMHHWAYHELAEGMQDVFLEAGTGWGGTYHSSLPFVRIDHILVSKEWEVVSASVPQIPFSDHLPVQARIRWRKWNDE